MISRSMTLLSILPAIIYLIVFLSADVVVARTVYKWVDHHGFTHYGENPPQEFSTGLVSVKSPPVTIEIPASSSSRVNTASDYYSVVNQANRMQASRLARERLRLERRKAEEEALFRRWSYTQNVYKNLEHSAIIYPRYYGIPLYYRPPPVTFHPYRPPFNVFPHGSRPLQHNKFPGKVFKFHQGRNRRLR